MMRRPSGSPWLAGTAGTLACLLSLGMFQTPVRLAAQGAGGPLPVGSAAAAGTDVPFIRGDVNLDLAVDISDAVAILAHLFPPPELPQPPPLACRAAADTNDDDLLNIGDAIYLLGFLFAGSVPPPAPFPDCGMDPTPAASVLTQLTCRTYPSCLTDNDPALVAHVLRRVAYGPTPALTTQVQASGALAYIQEQLDDLVDDASNTRLNTLLGALNAQGAIADLQRAVIARSWLSRQQLREHMTDFWENHFNTHYLVLRDYLRAQPGYTLAQANAEVAALEGAENATLRALALGSFHDLLLASAMGVPMLQYLDSHLNLAAAPNENYARELFELHTMGVDNGYDQTDIEQMARCLTGWTLCKKAPADVADPFAPCLGAADPTGVWTFHFDATRHDYGAKTLTLGSQVFQIPARPALDPAGLQDGLVVMEWLAKSSPQTAEFVSSKLIRKFVSDTPPPALVAECLGVWFATQGNVREVLQVILTSDEFLLATHHRWNLVRTPIEYMTASARVLDDGSLSALDDSRMLTRVRTALAATNNLPFNWNTPDGYPGTGADQLGSAKVLERIDFNRVIFDGAATDPEYDLLGLLADQGVPAADPGAIADFFLGAFYPGHVSPEERQLAIEYLASDLSTPPMPSPLDPLAPDYEARLRNFVVFVASYPHSLKQ